MNIDELKDTLRQIITLRDEIADLKKGTRFGYSLSEYIDQVRDKIAFADHGDRDKFFMPSHIAREKLNELKDKGDSKINSDFSVSKTKLLSIINRYIKDLQLGFEQHDTETKSFL